MFVFNLNREHPQTKINQLHVFWDFYPTNESLHTTRLMVMVVVALVIYLIVCFAFCFGACMIVTVNLRLILSYRLLVMCLLGFLCRLSASGWQKITRFWSSDLLATIRLNGGSTQVWSLPKARKLFVYWYCDSRRISFRELLLDPLFRLLGPDSILV